MDGSRTQAWEYRVLRPERAATRKEAIDPVDDLNDLGAEGWELATTVDYVGGGTKFLVLKRPADAEASRD